MKVLLTPILPVRSFHFLLPIILLSLAMSVPLFAFKSDKTSFKRDTGEEHATFRNSRKSEAIRSAGKETAISPRGTPQLVP